VDTGNKSTGAGGYYPAAAVVRREGKVLEAVRGGGEPDGTRDDGIGDMVRISSYHKKGIEHESAMSRGISAVESMTCHSEPRWELD